MGRRTTVSHSMPRVPTRVPSSVEQGCRKLEFATVSEQFNRASRPCLKLCWSGDGDGGGEGGGGGGKGLAWSSCK